MTTLTIALLLIVVYLVDSAADLLNYFTSKKPLPAQLQSVQTPEQQARATQYLHHRIKLGQSQGAVNLIVLLTLLYQGFFGWLQIEAADWSASPLWQALYYGATFTVLRALINLPFAAYSTFVIEEKYGFNRTTVKTFVTDRLKGALIGAILGGLLFSFIISMYVRFNTDAFWIIWLGYTAFQFFIVWIAPVTLLPLFLKLSPLPDGPLKQSIEAYRQKQNFKLDGAWVCDASKRSAKSNAFFTGFGKFRRLVLFDTLIAQHPEAEITAIVAHEAGHFKLGHIWKGSIVSAVTSLVLFFVIQQLIHWEDLYTSFQAAPGNLGIGLILAMLVLDQVNFFFSPLGAYFSRRNEYAADRFSIQTTGDIDALANGLKRLVTENLATLQHHPLYTLLHDTHPPLPDRIAAMEVLRSGGTKSTG